jgi:hypothetical protein
MSVLHQCIISGGRKGSSRLVKTLRLLVGTIAESLESS